MAKINYEVRQAVADLVKQIMDDYASEIEEAYCSKDGEFKIGFNAKLMPAKDKIKAVVEMSFDPAVKIKDKVDMLIGEDPLFRKDYSGQDVSADSAEEANALSEDADREMVGDDVDSGIRDVGNK